MHTQAMRDDEGDFSGPLPIGARCRVGGCEASVTVRSWESHCGGYLDHKYECTAGHSWWVEGPDA